MNIVSRHSNSNVAHHNGMWSLFEVIVNGRLHNNTHQRDALHNKLIPKAEFVRHWKLKEWAKSDWECTVVWNDYLLNFLTKVSYFTSQEVGNPVQVIKCVESPRFQPILKLSVTFVETLFTFKPFKAVYRWSV